MAHTKRRRGPYAHGVVLLAGAILGAWPWSNDSARAASPQPPGGTVTVHSDSTMTIASGATFTAPRGWTVRTRDDGLVILEAPDRAVSVTIIERGEQDGEAAIAAAWAQVLPGFSRPIVHASTPPGRDGWDAAATVSYENETTPAGRRVTWAQAGRKGDTWYVLLCDGTDDGWVARAPGARIAIESFRARGVEAESFRGRTAHILDEERLRDLEAFLVEGQRAGKIPGLAVAIVQGGKVVFEKGFGVRELGMEDPVTPNTLFRIGSTTKALTSLLVAALVDDGRFGWETPAIDILPSFALGSADLTKRMTMSGLLCACSGIPYDNLGVEFDYDRLTPEGVLLRLKEVKPVTGFGETYQYSNAMIAAAGYLAAHAMNTREPMGDAYREALRTRILLPLGMTSTVFTAEAARRADRASPHDRSPHGELITTPVAASAWTEPLDPAWGAWSSVRDLSRYVLMELARGKTPEGKRVVSEANLLKRREPQGRAGETSSYGLGLVIEDEHGVEVLGHHGGVWGFSSEVFFLPEHDVGAVFLKNVDYANPFDRSVFRRKLLELLFDGRDEAREDLAFRARTQEEEFAAKIRDIDLDPDPSWLDPFAGSYEHPWFGRVTLGVEGGAAFIDVGEWRSRLGRRIAEDGSLRIALTSAPWVGWGEFVPEELKGRMRLHLDAMSGPIVVFEPVK